MGMEEDPTRLIFRSDLGEKFLDPIMRKSPNFLGEVEYFLCRCARSARKRTIRGHFKHFSWGFLLHAQPAELHKCRDQQGHQNRHLYSSPSTRTRQQLCTYELRLFMTALARPDSPASAYASRSRTRVRTGVKIMIEQRT